MGTFILLERTVHSVEKKKTSFDLTDRTEGYEGQSSWKSRRYQFEPVRFSMFTVPLITLAALLLTQKTSCELLAKEQDLVNHGIINKSHKEAMFSSTSLGNQRRLKEKDVVADFVLMRRLDEHQVCRSLPIKISTKFIIVQAQVSVPLTKKRVDLLLATFHKLSRKFKPRQKKKMSIP